MYMISRLTDWLTNEGLIPGEAYILQLSAFLSHCSCKGMGPCMIFPFRANMAVGVVLV